MQPVGLITLKSASGKAFRFNVYPKDIEFRYGPAIYAFLAKTSLNTYEVLYIGQTINVKGRFDSHHKWDEATRHGFSHVALCRDISLEDLVDVEADLIQSYRPRCNQVVPH